MLRDWGQISRYFEKYFRFMEVYWEYFLDTHTYISNKTFVCTFTIIACPLKLPTAKMIVLIDVTSWLPASVYISDPLMMNLDPMANVGPRLSLRSPLRSYLSYLSSINKWGYRPFFNIKKLSGIGIPGTDIKMQWDHLKCIKRISLLGIIILRRDPPYLQSIPQEINTCN